MSGAALLTALHASGAAGLSGIDGFLAGYRYAFLAAGGGLLAGAACCRSRFRAPGRSDREAMLAIRLVKTTMVASLALFALLVAYNNVVDYGSNYNVRAPYAQPWTRPFPTMR